MRRLAQFVRLHLSRVCLASVCVCLASVCVWLSLCVCICLASACVCICLTSACVCVCLASASVSRLHLSRVKGSECVRLRASVLRLRASVCLRLFTSRVPNARVCLRRSSCLACVCPCECLRELAHFMRRSSFKEFKRFLLSSYYRCTYRLCRLYEQTFNILI